ncbi:hypothetical protein PN836_001370 [Ningiella sp. W23]|uniref:hypothetical protein n=1 Tax=Ningiella sp. W23 TaxID=3023715 RepID=UPI00375648B4
MKNLFSTDSISILLCKNIVLAFSLIVAAAVHSAPVTYNFTLGGFSNGGEVVGSFTGEDLNGDGYLSSFIFSDPNNLDFAGSNFEAGLNEVSSASISFSGSFDGQEFGGDGGQVTEISLFHDLTDIRDTFFGFAPIDLFFILNYNIAEGGVLGDEFFEGILLAPFDGFGVFGLGSFLPAPPDNFLFFDEIPAGDDVFEIIDGLPNGSTLTSGILNNQSGGTPCLTGAACGVLHTVFLDENGIPNLGGFDITNQLLEVSRVSTPSVTYVFSAMIALLIATRIKRS